MSEHSAESVAGMEHVRVLRLEPGDVLVLAYPEHLTVEIAEHLKEKLQREFPGHKAIVLDGGASFDVLRAAENIPDVDPDNLPSGKAFGFGQGALCPKCGGTGGAHHADY